MHKPNPSIQRHNLADAVVSKLQQQISLGEYHPGEKLPSEPALMELLGVGRSTIREAIRILANTGMVSVRQGSGTFVESGSVLAEPLSQRLKRAEFADMDEVRQMLEMKIAEKAALNRVRKDVDKMKALLVKRESAAKANDTAECIRSDIQFHIAVAEASGNDILADLYKAFSEQISRSFRETIADTLTFLNSQALHESLLQSIIDKDPKKAATCAARILRLL